MMPPASPDLSAQDLLSPEKQKNLLTKVRATVVRQHLALLKTQFPAYIGTECIIVWLAWNHVDKIHLAAWFGALAGIHHPLELWGLHHLKRYPVTNDRISKWNYFVWINLACTSLFFRVRQ